MRKIISVILTLSLLTTLFSGSALAKPGKGAGLDRAYSFSDINGHWGKEIILKLKDRGLFNGYEDGTFRPDNNITHSELAVLIGLYLEKEYGIDNDDNDDIDDRDDLKNVPDWARKAVRKGLKHKYINLKRFNSNVQCSRLYASVQLAKALGLEPVTIIFFNPFKDSKLIPDEDYGYILALYKAGYIKGYPDGNFNPNKLISRAEMAAIIQKLLEKGGKGSGDTTAPNWPSGTKLEAFEVGSTQVSLRWTAAEDNEEIAGYKVICRGNGESREKEVGLSRRATIDGLEPGTEYKFTIEAKDSAGNWSDDGPSIDVTTEEDSDEEDREKPYWFEENLTVTNITNTGVTLSWSGAKDNKEVTAYRIYVNNRLKLVVDGDVSSQEVTGLSPGTNYTFRVEAGDVAGNWSEDGPSIFAQTTTD